MRRKARAARLTLIVLGADQQQEQGWAEDSWVLWLLEISALSLLYKKLQASQGSLFRGSVTSAGAGLLRMSQTCLGETGGGVS